MHHGYKNISSKKHKATVGFLSQFPKLKLRTIIDQQLPSILHVHPVS